MTVERGAEETDKLPFRCCESALFKLGPPDPFSVPTSLSNATQKKFTVKAAYNLLYTYDAMLHPYPKIAADVRHIMYIHTLVL